MWSVNEFLKYFITTVLKETDSSPENVENVVKQISNIDDKFVLLYDSDYESYVKAWGSVTKERTFKNISKFDSFEQKVIDKINADALELNEDGEKSAKSSFKRIVESAGWNDDWLTYTEFRIGNITVDNTFTLNFSVYKFEGHDEWIIRL